MGGNIAAGYVIDQRPKIHGLILTGSAIKSPKDLTYILGDITMEKSQGYFQLDRLTGRKIVVLGCVDKLRTYS